MGWRDRYNETASFRGVEFFIAGHSRPIGRNVQIDEYLNEDEVGTEDTGAVPKTFSLDALVIGPDYDRRRDALVKACDDPRPGTLVHPYFGELQVRCQPGTQSETKAAGGMARFQLNFVLYSPPLAARLTKNTATDVRTAVTAAEVALKSDFLSRFGVIGRAARVAQAAQAKVEEFGTTIDDQVRKTVGDPEEISNALRSAQKFSSKAGDFVTDPNSLVDAVSEQVRSVTAVDDVLEEGLRFAQTLASFGDEPPIPGGTPDRVAEESNRSAFNSLVRRAAVLEAANISTELAPVSGSEARSLRDRIVAQIDAEIIAAGDTDDDSFVALSALRAAVVADAAARITRLPDYAEVTPRAAMPALLLAHIYHGDATREQEIIDRNAIEHPALVPGGAPIEILVDAPA